MSNKGGSRPGAGRKSKVDEEKVNTLFLKALKSLYDKNTEDEAKESFIIDLAGTPRGKMFIAEHLFGKPKDVVEQINHNINREPTEAEAKAIAQALINEY